MLNGLVLGCGRSGTSLATGLFAHAYHVGRDLLPADSANPKGFFEDREVNEINEQLIHLHLQGRSPRAWWDSRRNRRVPRTLRWLVVLSGPIPSRWGRSLRDRIEAQLSDRPFLLKDPRFSYTLPAWQLYLPADCRFIVVFRHPRRTAESIVRRAEERGYRARLGVTMDTALAIWASTYQSILRSGLQRHQVMFVSYDRLVAGDGAAAMGRFLEAQPDPVFADARISRTHAPATDERLPRHVQELYDRLSQLEVGPP